MNTLRRRLKQDRSIEEWKAIFAKGKGRAPYSGRALSRAVNHRQQSLGNVQTASQTARHLHAMYDSARSPQEQDKIIWQIQQAASMAEAAAVSPNTSRRRRVELLTIADIYRKEAQRMKKRRR